MPPCVFILPMVLESAVKSHSTVLSSQTPGTSVIPSAFRNPPTVYHGSQPRRCLSHNTFGGSSGPREPRADGNNPQAEKGRHIDTAHPIRRRAPPPPATESPPKPPGRRSGTGQGVRARQVPGLHAGRLAVRVRRRDEARRDVLRAVQAGRRDVLAPTAVPSGGGGPADVRGAAGLGRRGDGDRG